METFSIAQVFYLFVRLGGVAIMVAGFVAVLLWPQVRSRGLFLAAIGLKAVVALAYLLLHFDHINFNQFFQFPGYMIEIVVKLVSLLSLVCDGLLLAALFSLGGVFRAIQRGREASAPPPDKQW